MADSHVRITGALSGALERGRDRFNAKFAEARVTGLRVEPDELTEHLAHVVAPIVDAVAIAVPEKVDAVTSALFDLSLELLSREYLGHGGPIEDVWRRLLPDIPTALAAAPRRVAGAMSNAAHQLAHATGARADAWLREMDSMGALFRTADEILAAGQVVAWRAGMAHLRQAALASIPSLRPELATAALGIDYNADVHMVLERLRVDPWADPSAVARREPPENRPRIRARVGAFRGFGGLFHTPPSVILVDRHFLVGDDEATWLLFADVFGATFTRTGNVDVAEDVYDPDPELRLTESGTVHVGGNMVRLEQLAGASSWASNGDTLVATLPLSHAVWIVSAR